MKSIAFYNNKGGVAKTTSVINLGYELAHDSKVLIIDTDGQAKCSRFFTDKPKAGLDKALACEYGIKQLESLIDSGYKIDLNQGMDARLVTREIAEILSKLKWIKYLRFSYDTMAQIEHIQKTAEMLGKRGIKPYRLFIYLLVTEDLDNAEYRVEQLKKLHGITIYAQAERKLDGKSEPNALQKEFCQRYVYSGKFRSVSCSGYAKERGLIT